MIYQSTVLVRGFESPIIVPKHVAEEVAKIRANKEIDRDHLIQIKHLHFLKGDIRNIVVLADRPDISFNDEVHKFYEEEMQNRKKVLSLSPKVRSQNLSVFIGLYDAANEGEKPSKELLEQARRKQEIFFTTHPNRVLCNPVELTPLIPKVKSKRVSPFRSAFLRLVERAVVRDMQLSR